MRTRIVEITASLEGDRQKVVNVILTQLFPNFGWALGGSHYGVDWNTEWLRERRICSQRHFDRYFMLRLPDGQISDSEFRDFLELNEKAKIVEVFKTFDHRGLLPVLLARLDEINRELPLENIASLLPALFDIGESYDNSGGFSLSTPFIATWRTASWYLKGVEDIELRGQILLTAMSDSIGLAVPDTLINLEDDRREKEDSDDGRTLTDAHLACAKDILLQKIRALSATPSVFLDNLHFVRLLHTWKRIAGRDEVQEWVAAVVDDVALLPKLLTAFTFIRQSQTLGDYVAQSKKVFELRIFKDFADLDQVNVTLRRLAPLELTEAETGALAALATALSGSADGDFPL